MTSRIRTTWRRSFGTSIPTLFFPGIGATMRTLGTRSAMAKSSARPAILLSRRPASSSISYCAITGPVSISTTLMLNPKLANVCSKTFAFFFTSSVCSSYDTSSDSVNKSSPGRTYSSLPSGSFVSSRWANESSGSGSGACSSCSCLDLRVWTRGPLSCSMLGASDRTELERPLARFFGFSATISSTSSAVWTSSSSSSS